MSIGWLDFRFGRRKAEGTDILKELNPNNTCEKIRGPSIFEKIIKYSKYKVQNPS